MRILVTGFMDEQAVAQSATRHDVLHDPGLVDHPGRLHAQAATADAVTVRDRTEAWRGH